MRHHIPCITDSDEFRLPEECEEEVSQLTDAEKRMEWICDSWAEAISKDTFEEWYNMRCELYGAAQALNNCRGHVALYDRIDISFLQSMAFENSMTCISEGKYE